MEKEQAQSEGKDDGVIAQNIRQIEIAQTNDTNENMSENEMEIDSPTSRVAYGWLPFEMLEEPPEDHRFLKQTEQVIISNRISNFITKCFDHSWLIF